MSFGGFLIVTGVCCASFGLGYWIAGHPDDARNLWQRMKDAAGALWDKLAKKGA